MFSGMKTFKKADEVQSLIKALQADGISEEDVSVVNVQLETDNFAKIKSSACRFTLVIRKVPAELLSSVLATLAAQKQANMKFLLWQFSTLASEIETLRSEVIQQARTKAASTAAALGVSLLGVYSFDEKIHEPDSGSGAGDLLHHRNVKAKRAKMPQQLGFTLSYSAELTLTVQATFRVSPMAAGT